MEGITKAYIMHWKKAWKDDQQEGLPNQECLKDCKGIAKELENETKYRREKKEKALKSYAKESSARHGGWSK